MDSQHTRRLQVASIISPSLDCCKTGIILGQRTRTTHTLWLTLDLLAQKACSKIKPEKRNYYIHRIDVDAGCVSHSPSPRVLLPVLGFDIATVATVIRKTPT